MASLTGVPRYELTIHMRNHFWKRWQAEDLQRLQQLSKWLKPNHSIQEGDLVLLSNDLCSPFKWPLARVLQLHPGSDGHTQRAWLHSVAEDQVAEEVLALRRPSCLLFCSIFLGFSIPPSRSLLSVSLISVSLFFSYSQLVLSLQLLPM